MTPGETAIVIGTVAVAVIGAIRVAAVEIIKTMRAEVQVTRAVVENRATSQDEKLKTIEQLVDGGKSELLDELADMKELFAKATGLRVDAEAAQSARKKADDQAARVFEAKPK